MSTRVFVALAVIASAFLSARSSHAQINDLAKDKDADLRARRQAGGPLQGGWYFCNGSGLNSQNVFKEYLSLIMINNNPGQKPDTTAARNEKEAAFVEWLVAHNFLPKSPSNSASCGNPSSYSDGRESQFPSMLERGAEKTIWNGAGTK